MGLTNEDFAEVAERLHCSTAVVRAVCDIESAGSGFLVDGRPKILFESHVFGRLTRHQWDRTYPNISSPTWNRSLYGAAGAHQYERLEEAQDLDHTAALQSASYGMFQVMGFNYKACCFIDVDAFVAAMYRDERAHLDAFVAFCEHNGFDRFLATNPPQFASFSRGYNGPGYAANGYDTKLAAAWRKHLANEAPQPDPQPRTQPALFLATLQLGSYGDAVRQLQLRLVELGYDIDVDGDLGPESQWAVVDFQRKHGLVADGIVGKNTRAALNKHTEVVLVVANAAAN